MEATIYLQDVYHITGLGVVPVGEVKSGTLRVGMRAGVNGKTAVVKTIEMHHEQLQEAHAGDNIGFSLGGVGKKDLFKGTTIRFSDQESPAAAMPAGTNPEPIHPKGFLGGLFGRRVR
ncbi:hypothetical protein GF367_02300 [Candidatus Woesearchaeota archaeon]|nr:hypothetical protein [Candidatus Woesearchaeota archaeon]